MTPSLTPRQRVAELSKEVSCPTCGAKPGTVCRTRNGVEAQTPHLTRTRAAYRKRNPQ